MFLALLFDDCGNLKNKLTYDTQTLEKASKITIHPEKYLLELYSSWHLSSIAHPRHLYMSTNSHVHLSTM
jgi:hypothetical protein